jgi:hypothetical protein
MTILMNIWKGDHYVSVKDREKYIKLDTGLSKNNTTLERLVNNG